MFGSSQGPKGSIPEFVDFSHFLGLDQNKKFVDFFGGPAETGSELNMMHRIVTRIWDVYDSLLLPMPQLLAVLNVVILVPTTLAPRPKTRWAQIS